MKRNFMVMLTLLLTLSTVLAACEGTIMNLFRQLQAQQKLMRNFAAGKAGMIFDGSWRSSAFKAGAVAATLEGKVGFVALPAFPDAKGDQTSINANYGNGYGFF